MKSEIPEQSAVSFPLRVVTRKENQSLPEDCIFVGADEPPDKVASFMSESGIWNLIQEDFDKNGRLRVASRLIEGPQHFITHPSQQILTPGISRAESPVIEKRWKFRSTSEKELVINLIEKYIGEIPGAKGITVPVLGIAEELFTNALFNAPFGDLESTLDRSTVVVLDPDMSAEIIIGHTPDRLFVGCLDHFGTLDCRNLLDRIFRGFSAGIANSVNMEIGGAGIGVLRMVDLSADIYVVVEKDKKTLVGSSFGLKKSPKKIRQAPKSFHFQSFQLVESIGAQIRIERRGGRALFRMSGKMSDNFPFGEIDLNGITELALDLRHVNTSNPQSLRGLFEIFRNIPGLKSLHLDYVSEVFFLEKENLGETRSVCLNFSCAGCGNIDSIFFTLAKDDAEGAATLDCSKCHGPIAPSDEIKKLIQK